MFLTHNNEQALGYFIGGRKSAEFRQAALTLAKEDYQFHDLGEVCLEIENVVVFVECNELSCNVFGKYQFTFTKNGIVENFVEGVPQ